MKKMQDRMKILTGISLHYESKGTNWTGSPITAACLVRAGVFFFLRENSIWGKRKGEKSICVCEVGRGRGWGGSPDQTQSVHVTKGAEMRKRC